MSKIFSVLPGKGGVVTWHFAPVTRADAPGREWSKRRRSKRFCERAANFTPTRVYRIRYRELRCVARSVKVLGRRNPEEANPGEESDVVESGAHGAESRDGPGMRPTLLNYEGYRVA